MARTPDLSLIRSDETGSTDVAPAWLMGSRLLRPIIGVMNPRTRTASAGSTHDSGVTRSIQESRRTASDACPRPGGIQLPRPLDRHEGGLLAQLGLVGERAHTNFVPISLG